MSNVVALTVVGYSLSAQALDFGHHFVGRVLGPPVARPPGNVAPVVIYCQQNESSLFESMSNPRIETIQLNENNLCNYYSTVIEKSPRAILH